MTNKQKGILCAIAGPVLWGFSGNVAEYLFDQPGIRPDWLVAVRMLGAGMLLMLVSGATRPRELAALTHDKRALMHSILFGLCGVFVSQFTYFSAVAASNAPTTTVLQALGPVFIILYLALRQRRWPPRLDVISVAIALVGILLLVTHGHVNQLALTPTGLFWGIGAGVGAALYTLMPGNLLQRYPTQLVLAWAMFAAGIANLPVLFFTPMPHLTGLDGLAIAYVTIGGTLFAYLLYVSSLKYLRPTTVGMLGVFEPLTATVVAVIFFHLHFGLAEIIGGLLVLSVTFLQTLPARSKLPKRAGSK